MNENPHIAKPPIQGADIRNSGLLGKWIESVFRRRVLRIVCALESGSG